MGISPSKRVSTNLTNSPEFNAACDSVYSQCLSLTQHAFPGLLPYQLTTATDLLHSTFTTTSANHHHHHSLITNWLPSPPTRSQVDSAIKLILTRRRSSTTTTTTTTTTEPDDEQIVLGLDEFKDFAVEVFTAAVVDNAGKAVRKRVPIGIGGIVGVGMMTRSGKDLIGTAVGAFALGVATSVYLGLSD